MTGMGERWTADQVLALAPDAASHSAGIKLGVLGPWSGASAGDGAVWGLCKGSGKKPYQTVVAIHAGRGGEGEGDGAEAASASATLPGYKCSCPSRKFPCKHALGLLLLWAEGPSAVPDGERPPEWAATWLDGRRQRAARRAESAPADAGGGRGSDPEAARRRAERRAERITAGATELEQRLADLLRGGLAGAERTGYAAWDETAARMVDAQAPGLASRVRELGAVPASGDGWPGRLLEECALLHLLNEGFLGISRLPGPLAATVRSRVGVTTDKADLLASEGGGLRDRWLVLGMRDSEDGALTTRRIWLRGERSRREALLLSYGAAGHAPELVLPTGLALDADLTFYPGSRPLRAAVGAQFAPPAPAAPGGPPPGSTVGAALSAYGDAVRDDPWLDAWPVVLSDVVPIPAAHGWQLADAAGDEALPVDPRCLNRSGLWKLAAVSGGAPLTVFGECGHRGFTPLTAWPADAPDAVPL
ncbi:SWIM zinc finger family protein [Streptomyces sp. NPDC047108]|uniref:SWIM zinc finger family protein n=1 Tax=Streptomyces sp. NPDC047108 TaxID=3155025 RepID=UPI0033F7CC05